MDVAIDNSNNATATITDQLYNGVTFVMSGVVHKIEADRKLEEAVTLRINALGGGIEEVLN